MSGPSTLPSAVAVVYGDGNPRGSPNGFGRSPTIAFPGAVRTFTLSVLEGAGAVTLSLCSSPFVPPMLVLLSVSERVTFQGKVGRSGDESIGRTPPQSDRTLTVDLVGALADFDDVTVRIADVATYLAVFGYRRRDELGSSAFP